MADNIIIKYEADVTALQVSLNKVEKEMVEVDKAAKKTNQDIQTGAAKSAKEVQKVEKNTRSLSNELGNLAQNLPFASQVQQVIQFGSAILGVGKAAGGTTSAFKLLKTAIISTGIGALVLAIMGLVQWFSNTDRGAVRLGGIMKGLTLTMNRLIQPFVDFAESLFETGKNAKSFGDIMTDLGKKIVDNFVNRFKSIFVLFDAVKLAFAGDFAAAAEKGADAFIQATTGITDGVKKTRAELEKFQRDQEYGFQLEQAMDNVSDAMVELSIRAAEANKQIAQLFLQARNRAIDAEKRQNLFVKALDIEKAVTEEQIALQKRKIALEDEWILAHSQGRKKEIVEVDKMVEGKLQREYQYKNKRITLAEAVAQNLINLNDDELNQFANNRKELIALEEGRIRRTEKALNGIAGLRDAAFAEVQQKQAESLKVEETQLKESLANRQMTEEQYAEASLYNIIKLSDDSIEQYNTLYKSQLDLLNQNLKKGHISQEQYAGQVITLNEDTQKKINEETSKQADARLNILKLQQKQELELYQKLQNDIVVANKNRIDEISSQTSDNKSRLAESVGLFTDIARAEKEINAQAKKDILQQEKKAIEEQYQLALEASKAEGELGKKGVEDSLRLAEELKKKEVQIEEEKANEKLEKAKEYQATLKQIAQTGIQIISDISNAIAENALNNTLANIEAEKNARFEVLDQQAKEQQRQYDAGVISKAQFDARVERLEEKKRQAEANAKRKAFEANKTAAIVQAIINGALAFTTSLAQLGVPFGLITGALALASAGVQIGIIASQPTPKFKKGGMIQGKSHEQGGVHIEAEGGEYIVNRSQTSKHKSVLEQINKGNFDKYVQENYVLPQLKKSILSNKEIAYNNKNTKLLESMALNGLVDTSGMERAIRKNKSVRIENANDIADSIADKITKKNYVK